MTKEMKADAAQNEANKQVDRRFLSFFLADEAYGLEILKVRETKGCMGLMPGAPELGTPERQKTNLSDPKRKKVTGN